MNKTILTILTLVVLSVTALAIAPSNGKASPEITSAVYSDNLVNGWQNWSWGSSVNLQDAAYRRTGSYSLGVTHTGAWGGLQPGHDGFNTSGYSYLVFYINGGAASGRQLTVNLADPAGNYFTSLDLDPYITGGSVAANTWRKVALPLLDLQGVNTTIGAIVVMDAIGSAQPRYYIDDMQFESDPNATPTFTPTRTRTGTPPTSTRTGTALPTATPASGLPPVPAGVPGYFSYGLFNASTSTLHQGVPYNFRYQYLAGGVNTGDGWAHWNPNGGYATNYINDARSVGMIPTFIYYQIFQSAPNFDEYPNLQNTGTMRDYYDDFKLLMQRCAEAGGTIFVDIEPDLTGVMQQHSSNTGNDASRQPASVASSGHPDVGGIANNFRGVYQALAHIRDVYAPNVKLGLDFSPWGAGADINLVRDPSFDWQGHATDTATYVNSLGPGYQLLFYNPSDRDAAWYQITQGSNRWWDPANAQLPHFNRMAEWIGVIVRQTQKRVMLWQVPNGNQVYRTENNTDGHWQDNRAEYFLNPVSGRAHISGWANVGVLGILFGAGVGSQSHYFDYKSDGVTNPAPINGNVEVSAHPDDDGGYLRLGVGAYYAAGTIPLPGGGTSSTSTRTGTRTHTPTRIATSTPVPSGCEAVVWAGLVNTTATGNSLRKTGGSPSAWDAGGVSTRAILSGNGYAQITVDALNTYRMFGLSTGNSNANHGDIDFAAYLAGGSLMVYEKGLNKGSYGSLAVGDAIRVAVEGGVVKYYRNGALVYTSAARPIYPLLVDTAINSSTGSLSNVLLCGASLGPNATFTPTIAPTHTRTATPRATHTPASGCRYVSWTRLTNATATGSSLQKTGGSPSTWDAGGVSDKTILSGNGYVQITVDALDTYRMFGLNNSDTGVGFNDIDYAAYLAGDTLKVYELGLYRGTYGSLAVGDTIRVAIEGGAVKYYRNATLVYTSAGTPVYPMMMDASVNSLGGRVTEAVLCGASLGSYR